MAEDIDDEVIKNGPGEGDEGSESGTLLDQQFEQDWVDDLQISLSFLTRIPVPGGPAIGNPSLSQATRFFPLIGFLVGIIGALALWVANWLGLPELAAIIFGLLAIVLVTGGLHEDGLADSCDGLAGGTNVEQRLEIMKDSRIGSFGVLGLMFTIALKLAGLSTFDLGGAALTLFLAAVVSRGALPLFMRYIPNAKQDGLSADAGAPGFDRAAISVLITIVIAWFCIGFFKMILVFIMLTIASILSAIYVKRRIGGQTGDILGAMQQMTEVIVILTLTATGLPS